MVIHLRSILIGAIFLLVSIAQADIKTGDTRIAVFHSEYPLFSDTMLYVLPSLQHIDQELMRFVIQETYGKTPEQIIAGLTYFYIHTADPLLTAARALAEHKDYLDAAIDVTQCILDALPAYSAQATEVQEWLDDLNIVCTCVEYVLLILKDNPQLVALILK